MTDSTQRILTTHAGSLPRTDALLEANRLRDTDPDAFGAKLAEAVDEVVAKQAAIGIDIVNDGEYGHATTKSRDFGSWWTYSFDRTAGLELLEENIWQTAKQSSAPGDVKLTGFLQRRDRQLFPDVYADANTVHATTTHRPAATSEISYIGQDAVASDIRNLQAARAQHPGEGAFLCAIGPGAASRIGSTHYRDDDSFLRAWADVLHEEYRAITDAGLTVQIDDPGIAENFDQIEPEPSVSDYLDFTAKRVEALNWALRDIPTEQTRFHLCWGSWNGPHTTDFPLKDLVGLLLEIDASAYSFEAAGSRHEHEWDVWNHVDLPANKKIIPGVVTHHTNIVEHPELVAQRIRRFTDAVGPDRVIASTDCGLGGRIHPDIAWAKLDTLVKGAELASEQIFG